MNNAPKHVAPVNRSICTPFRTWNGKLLANTLMRTSLVVELHILLENTAQVLLVHDQNPIETVGCQNLVTSILN